MKLKYTVAAAIANGLGEIAHRIRLVSRRIDDWIWATAQDDLAKAQQQREE